MCDNDNIGVVGEPAGVMGTFGIWRYLAPEVVVGKAEPSTQTDLYSLAVLLFIMLITTIPWMVPRRLGIPRHGFHAMRRLAKWTVTTKPGEGEDIETGRSVPIDNGIKINFGKIDGDVTI